MAWAPEAGWVTPAMQSAPLILIRRQFLQFRAKAADCIYKADQLNINPCVLLVFPRLAWEQLRLL